MYGDTKFVVKYLAKIYTTWVYHLDTRKLALVTSPLLFRTTLTKPKPKKSIQTGIIYNYSVKNHAQTLGFVIYEMIFKSQDHMHYIALTRVDQTSVKLSDTSLRHLCYSALMQ